MLNWKRAKPARPTSRPPTITDVGQVYALSSEEWFALPYQTRLETIKLYLRREYPQNYPNYEWPVFVLVEDATAIQLLNWQNEGSQVYLPVPNAIQLAVGEVVDRAKREGYVSETFRATDIARRKEQG
jgi:hypothetical protein